MQPKGDDVKGCRPLEKDEVNRIALGMEVRERALFLVGCYTGFRISELLSVTCKSIRDALATGRLAVARKSTKGKVSGRAQKMHPVASAAAAAWLAELDAAGHADDAAPFFRSREKGDDGRPRALSRVQAWRVLRLGFTSADVAGPTGTHSMRKTYADRVYRIALEDVRNGRADAVAPIHAAQRALGHKRLESTLSYLSFADTIVDSIVDRM